MNSELFDYFRAFSKKDYFFVNFLCTCFSVVIILTGIVSMFYGESRLLYTIMFGCAALVLWLNSFKLFKRRSKNAGVLIVAGIIMLAAMVLCLLWLFGIKLF